MQILHHIDVISDRSLSVKGMASYQYEEQVDMVSVSS